MVVCHESGTFVRGWSSIYVKTFIMSASTQGSFMSSLVNSSLSENLALASCFFLQLTAWLENPPNHSKQGFPKSTCSPHVLRQNSGASSSFQRSRSLRPNFRVYTLNQGSCTSSRDINILSLHMNDDLHSAIDTPSFFQAFWPIPFLAIPASCLSYHEDDAWQKKSLRMYMYKIFMHELFFQHNCLGPHVCFETASFLSSQQLG